MRISIPFVAHELREGLGRTIRVSKGNSVRLPVRLLHSPSKPPLWRVRRPTLAWVKALS